MNCKFCKTEKALTGSEYCSDYCETRAKQNTKTKKKKPCKKYYQRTLTNADRRITNSVQMYMKEPPVKVYKSVRELIKESEHEQRMDDSAT
jgi:hypothetical protein